MIVPEIQALIMKLLLDPENFTLAQKKDLEGKLAIYEKAKAMRLNLDLVDDRLMVEEGASVEVL